MSIKVPIEYAELSLLVRVVAGDRVMIEQTIDQTAQKYKAAVIKLLEDELKRLGGPNVSI